MLVAPAASESVSALGDGGGGWEAASLHQASSLSHSGYDWPATSGVLRLRITATASDASALRSSDPA